MNYVKKSGINENSLKDLAKSKRLISVTAKTAYKYNLPESVDWRTKGVVNPIKDQGACGSCAAFATTSALESHVAIATGNLSSLSEQNLVDCALGRDGCDGGGAQFSYVQQNGGIALDSLYPYTSGKTGTWNGQCFYNKSLAAPGVSVAGWVNLPWGNGQFGTANGNELDLQLAVANHGPVWITLPVTAGWQFYSSGTLIDPYCSNTSINHAVTVVGYDTDSNGIQNYILRNQWGTNWGNFRII
jgi:C1A family cysteine protease